MELMRDSFLLDQDLYTLVDPEDYERFKEHSFSLCGKYPASYVAGKTQYLHRLIMNAPLGMYVDHINGNPLDNRKQNLRLVTPTQSQYNKLAPVNKKSKLPKGVGIRNGLYTAKIKHNGITMYLGSFITVDEAELAYKKKANEVQGIHAAHNSRPLGVHSDTHER